MSAFEVDPTHIDVLISAALVRRHGDTWIDWDAARAFVDAGARASTSEMAILDLAVALGENRYRLSIMGHAHSAAIARAVADAVDVPHPAEWGTRRPS